MRERIMEVPGDLQRARIIGRPNRFLLTVAIGSREERVYLPNPGVLSTVYSAGRDVLITPADSDDRKTDFDAVAIDTGVVLVIVDTRIPNTIFEELVGANRLPAFTDYTAVKREPAYPDSGRGDFLLQRAAGPNQFVEIKACSHVEERVALFPDAPTKRGRRHLRSLRGLDRNQFAPHVVFIVQRPDADRVRPFRTVDPEFASLLHEAISGGVRASAITIEFDPPWIFLANTDVPVEVPEPDPDDS